MGKLYGIIIILFFLLTSSTVSKSRVPLVNLANSHSAITTLFSLNTTAHFAEAPYISLYSYKIKTKPKVKVRYRAKYYDYTLVRIPVTTYKIFISPDVKFANRSSFEGKHSPFQSNLRGPPTLG